MMNSPMMTIAAKDMADAGRERFVTVLAAFLSIAALTALVAGAIALSTDVATYDAAKASLLALGKDPANIRAPEFYPLRLLRGTIEQIEIVGSAIAILIGFRAAAAERGRQTLALILTRPLKRWQFAAGKILAGLALLAGGMAAIFVTCALGLEFLAGVGLGLNDLGRLAIVWGVSVAYAMSFFLVSFMLTLRMRQTATALLVSFALWLLLVLIAPQIGDTMDPDNQVAGGVFKALSISRPDQLDIMKAYAGFETLRDGIEQASLTKHFERFSFAVLGIKATFADQPLSTIMAEKALDLLWTLLAALGLGGLALLLPIDPKILTQE